MATLSPKAYATSPSRLKLSSAALASVPHALRSELRSIETAINAIIDLLPTAASSSPLSPVTGTLRLAVPPSWDPLGNGGTDPYYVVWEGAAWASP